jgi:uncharacterized membrane protein
MNPKDKLLDFEQEKSIIKAIQEAENKSSGEIRVHITNKEGTGNLAHATEIFAELNMHKTKYRNGILLHISPFEKTFSIVGDEGIHQKVKQEFWDQVRDEVVAYFKNGNYYEGILNAIHQTGEKLQHYFPLDVDDKNELSDEISYT